MAIHFVLIYYLISHYSILAKSFGKDPASHHPSVFNPDASNSTLLSVTYDHPRPVYSSTHKPIRVKLTTIRPNALSNQIHDNPYQTEVPTRIYRARFPSLSPFVPGFNYHPRPRNHTNRLLNYPRILLGNREKFTPPLVTAPPAPPIEHTFTNVSFLEELRGISDSVIPVNLSAHFKLANTPQQQRVVLNNIQDIINSLKLEHQEQQQNYSIKANNSSNSNNKQNDNDKISDGEQVKSVVLIPNAAQGNHKLNRTTNHSVFKLRFFEKLRQSQNLLREQFRNNNNNKVITTTNSSFSGNSSKPSKNQNNSRVQDGPLLPKANLAVQSRLSMQPNTNSPKREMSPLVGTTAPSVFNRTNSLMQLMKSNTKLGSFQVASLPKFAELIANNKELPLNRTSEGDRDEGKFMTHLKDLLYRMENKHYIHTVPPSYVTQAKPEPNRLAIRSPLMSTNFDTSRIDYGEVERILAYVNPYGRRISMPHNEFSLAESQTHENRNLRFQRSSPIEWLNESAPDSSFLPSAPMNENTNLDLASSVRSRLNSFLSLSGQPHYSNIVEPFDLINFPTKSNRPNAFNFDKPVSVVKPVEVNQQQHISTGSKPKFGLRNNVDHSFADPFDFDFNWLDSNQTTPTRHHLHEDSIASNANSSKDHLPLNTSHVRSLTEIAKTPILYNPKESEFVHYPHQTFVGSEKWRQLNASLFSDGDRDWVSYFNDLERKMKIGKDFNSPAPKTKPAAGHLTPVRQNLPVILAEGLRGETSTDTHNNKKQELVSTPHKTSKNNRKESVIYAERISGKQQWQNNNKLRPTNVEQQYKQTPPSRATNRPLNAIDQQAIVNNGNIYRSNVIAQSTQPDVHFRPPSPFHLSRVIKYVNRAHPNWPNMPHYYPY